MSDRQGGFALPGIVLWGLTPFVVWIPFAIHFGWFGPLVSGSLAWLYLKGAVDRPRWRVVGTLLIWAAISSLATIVATRFDVGLAATVIPNGPAYWAEMKPYVDAGTGPESTPSLFIPHHVLHLVAFVVLSAVSGGWAGLILGSFLMGYMSFYVANVTLESESVVLSGLLAWHPWAVLRVIAFVMLGVSLSRLILDRLSWRVWLAEERSPLTIAAVLWVGDLGLKTVLSPHWWRVIRSVGGYGA